MRNRKWKEIFAWAVVFSFILTTFPVTSSTAFELADSVYINGNIYTMDKEQPIASALAIKGQRLIFVGSSEKIKNYIGINTKVTDLKGKTVTPGMMEGHMHFTSPVLKIIPNVSANREKDALTYYSDRPEQFEESLKGSLEIEKLAGLVVIDRDMKCPANEIKGIQALTSVLNAEIVPIE